MLPRSESPGELDFDQRRSLLDVDPEVRDTVLRILGSVREKGWESVCRFSGEFDDTEPARDPVSRSRIDAAWNRLSDDQREALNRARDRIRRYQQAIQPRSSAITDGDGLLGEVVRPVQRVGCYIPGGQVPLPSTVLMTAYIAELAGVPELTICSPPREDGQPPVEIKAAVSRLREADLFGIGGVQAIGAMAYGAGPIEPVDLIVGPGNLYVTLAKKEVYGDVEIDMLAGPSEIAVVAEEPRARADYVAADLLSQAEHDPRSRVFLVTPHETILDEVDRELSRQMEDHPNREAVEQALDGSRGIRVSDLEEAIETVNRIAPEHLELHVEDPLRWSRRCTRAAAVFCGPFSPEPVGDYLAGPSHTLPTGGSARFFSPLSIRTFFVHQSLVSMGPRVFERVRDAASTLADMESLPAHRNSIDIRERNPDRSWV